MFCPAASGERARGDLTRRTEYDASQAAKRLKVPAAAFWWPRHTGLIPHPDASSFQWSRAAVEALDADAVRAAMSSPPIGGGSAADRIADALGTPNVIDEKANGLADLVAADTPLGPEQAADRLRIRRVDSTDRVVGVRSA
jgi:hypothetical protein